MYNRTRDFCTYDAVLGMTVVLLYASNIELILVVSVQNEYILKF